MSIEKHTIEIVTGNFKYSLHAECSCGWKAKQFFHSEQGKLEAQARFDKEIAEHKAKYNGE